MLTEVESAGPDPTPDVVYCVGRRRNVYVSRLLWRGVGSASSPANKDKLTAEIWPDEAGGPREAGEDCFAEWIGDGDLGRHDV
ncbi:hypothetical protein KC345_g6771 [Hortaea werneckii]|nr:hypothetical protein KC345_g6771 [Hortaea werneckii]